MKWPISDWGDTNEEPIAITLPDIIIKTGHDSQLFKKIERIPNTDSPYAVKAAKEVIKKDKVAQRRLRKPDPYKRRGHSRVQKIAMKLTKSKLKEMIKEVIAETDGYTNLVRTNKELEHN